MIRIFFLTLLIASIPIYSALEPHEEFEFDLDTIEIIANDEVDHHSRVARDTLSSSLDAVEEEISSAEGATRATFSITCKTIRGEEGECKKFKDCYPLFYLRTYEQDSSVRELSVTQNIPVIERGDSFELESIYRNVSGPCDKKILDTIAGIDFGKGTQKEEYVCCPKNKNPPPTQPSLPPAPPIPRPEATNTKCGKILVEYKSSSSAVLNETVVDDDADVRIVNGRQANRGEFPWAVALMNNGRQFCGGSLISNRHILTAAHCVYYMNQKDVSRMRVQIGDHNIYSSSDGPSEVRSVSNVYYHRGFSRNTLYDDVSVIRLSKPVNFNKYAQPVCLHNGNPPYDRGTTGADVVGWGQIRNKGPQSNVLNVVNVRVLTQNECIKSYGNNAPAGIKPGMVCAGGKGRDSCKGDSGGPLTVNSHSEAKHIGIVSWGIGCATYPGVYTRVDKYLSWIYKNQR